jgi:hypothetical protein
MYSHHSMHPDYVEQSHLSSLCLTAVHVLAGVLAQALDLDLSLRCKNDWVIFLSPHTAFSQKIPEEQSARLAVARLYEVARLWTPITLLMS